MTNYPHALLLAVLTSIGGRSAAAADQQKEARRSAPSTPSTSAEKGEPDAEAIEHTIILGVGGAGEVELGDGTFHPGASIFFEYEAIENWLELELGASLLSSEGGIEVPIDLLVKKPFRLSRQVEFMPGLGPEIVRVSGTGKPEPSVESSSPSTSCSGPRSPSACGSSRATTSCFAARPLTASAVRAA